MKKNFLFVLLLLFIFYNEVIAREIVLHPGETAQLDDVVVKCTDLKMKAPLSLNECQYWDEYSKNCLYEKKVLFWEKLECVEQCQHWDSFNKTCYYATKCVFEDSKGLFVLTECMNFDTYSKKCMRTKEAIIR